MRQRIVISGVIACHPIYGAGNSWVLLQCFGISQTRFRRLFINRDEADLVELQRYGWVLASPSVHAVNIDAYRKYVIDYRGAFTAVKAGYALERTGWFSDRSACYLAKKPACDHPGNWLRKVFAHAARDCLRLKRRKNCRGCQGHPLRLQQTQSRGSLHSGSVLQGRNMLTKVIEDLGSDRWRRIAI
jgi:hypothetical protein